MKKKKNNILNKFEPLLKQLDYSIETYEERLDLVKEILNIEEIGDAEFADDFWLDIFEQKMDNNIDTSYLKTSLNQDDMLYTDTYVATLLEIFGTYLLNTPEIKEKEKEEEKKNGKIKIYHSKELFNRALQEKEVLNKLLPVDEQDLDLDILVKQRNYKKADDIIIKEKDIKKYPLLKTYNEYLLELKEKNRRLSLGNELTTKQLSQRRIIRKQIASVTKDMEYIYKSVTGMVKFKQVLLDNGKPDWDNLDMLDDKQVLELLKINKSDDINDDLNCIILDLECLIEKIQFTDKQKDILDMYRQGLNLCEIAEITGVTKQTVHYTLSYCTKKILTAYYDVLEDWYYLNINKGTYRKCNKCGENKLLSKFYKKGKDGHRYTCKECS